MRNLKTLIHASVFICVHLWLIPPASLAADRPNVVFILADDMRPDCIGALGHPVVRTPNLDRLVREGTTFTRAIAAYPLCVPSRIELLTGHVALNMDAALQAPTPRWPQVMAEGGYDTWYVGKWHTPGRPADFGYRHTRGLFAAGRSVGSVATIDRDANGRPVTGYPGWVFQDADGKRIHPERGVGLYPEISRDLADAAIAALGEPRDKPFFLHLNFTAPHDPLLMPPPREVGYSVYWPKDIPLPTSFQPQHPFDPGVLQGRDELLWPTPRTPGMVREELAVYYAVISHMDAQIGRVLDALEQAEQLENTLIIFGSDHGLAIGSHGLRGKQNMYDHSLGVPLILRGPGVPRGRRSDAQCYLRDLYPTVCELAGLRAPQGLHTASLVPVLRGETDSVHDALYAYYGNVQRAIRTDRWKLAHYPQIDRWQLFDLQTDPDELNDLSRDEAHAQTMADLQARLRQWQTAAADPVVSDEGNHR